MRTLVQAGVSDETLGRALRDLLMAPSSMETTEMATLTGPAEQTPESGALLAEPAAPGLVPLKVRFANGKASNVSIPAQLLQQVARKLGGETEARQRVRDLARDIPADVPNRSGRIQAALTELLTLS
jgi:hypothetical protein